MRPRAKPLRDTVPEAPKGFDELLNQEMLRGMERAKLEELQRAKLRGWSTEDKESPDSGTD
ncbi:MAG: hypothetical protein HUU60_09080 [Armatimonadetes bacterium]|nr:hypothetical protein [Armatimonadota bacterium]